MIYFGQIVTLPLRTSGFTSMLLLSLLLRLLSLHLSVFDDWRIYLVYLLADIYTFPFVSFNTFDFPFNFCLAEYSYSHLFGFFTAS